MESTGWGWIYWFLLKELCYFVEFSHTNKEVDFLQSITFCSKRVSVPLRQASSNHKISAVSFLLHGGKPVDGVKCLLNRILNKCAGVDDDNFRLFFGGCKAIATLVKVSCNYLTVNQIFSTSKAF